MAGVADGDGGRSAGAPEPIIDVAALMAELEQVAARRLAAGDYGADPADVLLDLGGPLDRLTLRATVRGSRESMAPASAADVPVSIARRAVVKAASPFLADILRQINAFHLDAVAALAAQAAELDEARERIADLERRLAALEGAAVDG